MEGSLKLKHMNEDRFADFHHHHEELLASQLVASVGKNFISSDKQDLNTMTSPASAKDTSKSSPPQSIRNQKKHLQKLIERLADMNPKKKHS